MSALLFPGQGSQVVGMGLEFYSNFKIVKQIFKQADENLNFQISKLILEGPENELQLTKNTQPAILTVSYSIFKVLKEEFNFNLSSFNFFAGHSLGEYSALVCADSIKFKDAKVPVENLLYEVGKGATIAFNALNIGRYKLGSASVGGSKQAIKQSIRYSLDRRQFGQPIARFDSILGKIANMTIRIYVADTMLYRTVGMIQDAIDSLDENDPKYYIRMGEAMEQFAIEASMAKVYGSETSSMIVDNCLQIFGGYGFIEEYPIAMAYRDDRINRIWEGTNEINRSIITGYLMKNVLMEEISLRDIIQTKEAFLYFD